MSNVIKAMNIRYTQEKRSLDNDAQAEGFRQLYFENLAKARELEAVSDEELNNDDSFGPEDGLEGENCSENDFSSGNVEIAENLEENEPSNHSFASKSNDSQVLTDIDSLTDEQLNAILSSRHIETVSSFSIEAEKMKAEARAECDQIIAEARETLEKEKETMYYEAKEQGYQDGLAAARSECDALKQELTEKLSSINEDFEKKVDELEPAFVDLMINLIQKITGILVEDRRDLILHIIRQSILDMENSNNYVIHVSKDDFDFVNSKKQELLFELKGNNIEVVEDPVLQRAQCTIETDTRIFDCSLDVQLKNLIADIRLLSGE